MKTTESKSPGQRNGHHNMDGDEEKMETSTPSYVPLEMKKCLDTGLVKNHSRGSQNLSLSYITRDFTRCGWILYRG